MMCYHGCCWGENFEFLTFRNFLTFLTPFLCNLRAGLPGNVALLSRVISISHPFFPAFVLHVTMTWCWYTLSEWLTKWRSTIMETFSSSARVSRIACRNMFHVSSLHKKWRISSVKVTKSAISFGFGHIYSRNP